MATLAIMAAAMVMAACNSAAAPTATPPAPTTRAAPTPAPAADGGGAAATTVPLDPAIVAKLDRIEAAVRRERGLGSATPERRFMTWLELQQYVAQQFGEEDAVRLRAFQRLRVLYGVLKETDNLEELTKRQLSQGILGFFDEDTGALRLVSDGAGVGLVEEFTHALQQARFDLKSRSDAFDTDEFLSDAEAAFSALVEGDASLSANLYAQSNMNIGALQRAIEAQASKQDDFPHVLQATLDFPYRDGLSFATSLYTVGRGWSGVDAAYARPPASTEQVLHLEKYVENEAPLAVDWADVPAALPPGWRKVDAGVSGELGWRVLLGAHLTASAANVAAAGWGGDRYIFLEGPGGALLYVASQRWDTAKDATEFAAAYAGFLRRQRAQVQPAPPGGVSAILNGGLHEVRVQGARVLITVTTDATLAAGVAALSPPFSG
ncbi:MAG: hypothetical protein EXR49_05080 [Dehalococcoidia bacterium]|nr:hypothetical protein [Dehalococcoidia bacterium]